MKILLLPLLTTIISCTVGTMSSSVMPNDKSETEMILQIHGQKPIRWHQYNTFESVTFSEIDLTPIDVTYAGNRLFDKEDIYSAQMQIIYGADTFSFPKFDVDVIGLSNGVSSNLISGKYPLSYNDIAISKDLSYLVKDGKIDASISINDTQKINGTLNVVGTCVGTKSIMISNLRRAYIQPEIQTKMAKFTSNLEFEVWTDEKYYTKNIDINFDSDKSIMYINSTILGDYNLESLKNYNHAFFNRGREDLVNFKQEFLFDDIVVDDEMITGTDAKISLSLRDLDQIMLTNDSDMNALLSYEDEESMKEDLVKIERAKLNNDNYDVIVLENNESAKPYNTLYLVCANIAFFVYNLILTLVVGLCFKFSKVSRRSGTVVAVFNIVATVALVGLSLILNPAYTLVHTATIVTCGILSLLINLVLLYNVCKDNKLIQV